MRFACDSCSKEFFVEVWHCPTWHHHWLMQQYAATPQALAKSKSRDDFTTIDECYSILFVALLTDTSAITYNHKIAMLQEAQS